MTFEPIFLNNFKPSGFEGYDQIEFKHGVEEIILHKIQLEVKKPHATKIFVYKKVAFLIETHRYNGFAMIKFYPKRFKSNPKKYKMRCHEIGYSLNWAQVRGVFYVCAKLMKEYLDKYPNHFIGYIAQPDKYDDEKKRLNSHRSIIYNPFTKSVFYPERYDVSSTEHPLMNFNICIVRNIRIKDRPNELTNQQKVNFESINNILKKYSPETPSFMTKERRIRIFGEDILDKVENERN